LGHKETKLQQVLPSKETKQKYGLTVLKW